MDAEQQWVDVSKQPELTEDQWMYVAKSLEAAERPDAQPLAITDAMALLERSQSLAKSIERRAQLVLMRAVVGATEGGGAGSATRGTCDESYDCISPPDDLTDDMMEKVKINLAEVDPDDMTTSFRRRVEALDLGKSAWGQLELTHGHGYGSSMSISFLESVAKSIQVFRDAFIEIDLSRTPMNAEQMGVFADLVVKGNTTLRDLTVHDSDLGADGVAFLASSLRRSPNSSLTKLSLYNVGLDDAALERLCKVLRQSDAAPKLSTLHVGKSSFTSLKPLVELLPLKPTLRELSIAHSQRIREGIDGLGDAIARSNLGSFRSHGCNMRDTEFAREIAMALTDGGTSVTAMKIQVDNFNQADYNIMGRAIAVNTSLMVLEMDMGNVMDMDADRRRGFFAGIEQNTSLVELVLEQARLTDESATQLAQAIRTHPNLCKLQATRCNFVKGGCVASWANLLRTSNVLCHLTLDTDWKDDDIMSILDSLSNNTSLVELKLQSNASSELRDALDARMKGDPRAEDLIASWCAKHEERKEKSEYHAERVSEQSNLRIMDYRTGQKVMVVLNEPNNKRWIPSTIIRRNENNSYLVTRDDGEPDMTCTLKQLLPRNGHVLPVGTIVDVTNVYGRSYRAEVLEALGGDGDGGDKYRVVPFWDGDPDEDATVVERHCLRVVLE